MAYMSRDKIIELPDDVLIRTYCAALKINVSNDFLNLIIKELQRRNIDYSYLYSKELE
ncbi:sporulation histidine kinase inhibitor Sda [Halobacillus sp. B23F22_1]|uniref:sporulation histidine kinase inhibitor Sda n=1 Tax=Halobacillus sp. B23F22_1 TaxID=3459514 RepID=UPI00373F2547